MLITFIFSFYDHVRFYLVSCQVLRPQSMWKDSISPAYEGNTFMVDMWKKTLRVRDDRRRLTVVRSLAYVQSYVHSPYMYTVLRCPANRWGRTLVQDRRIPTWDFGEIAGQSSCFSCFHAVVSHSVYGQLRTGSTGSHRHAEMTKQRVGFSSCDIRLGR